MRGVGLVPCALTASASVDARVAQVAAADVRMTVVISSRVLLVLSARRGLLVRCDRRGARRGRVKSYAVV
jgi:hypothetical protein